MATITYTVTVATGTNQYSADVKINSILMVR